jgi:outer membrane protein OmpA-like peptidoglycan-associated protein
MMQTASRRPPLRRSGSALGLALALALTAPAAAQTVDFTGKEPSAEEIERALTPKFAPGTRSIQFVEPPPASARFGIAFELNSAALTPEAQERLRTLGRALSADALSDFRFEIAGHTDASGEAGFNAELSEARAQSVQRFLVETFAFDPARLVTRGYGESQPIDGTDPLDGRNRRVEVINLGQ